ncbi:MAG: trigger factor [Patescibacteria group bacterium]
MSYTILSKKLLPKSQLELALELDAATVAATCAQVLEEAARETEIDGFRKGKVPKEIIRKQMGELALWEEAALRALGSALAEVFEKEKLDALGRPAIVPLKLAPENPAGFKIIVSLLPKLTLPDYKALASRRNKEPREEVTIGEKEIDAGLKEITDEHARRIGKKDFALSEESVKELGAFSSLADLRAKVTEGLTAHKKSRAQELRRAKLLDELTKETQGELPDVLIESELARMESECEGRLTRLGSSFETYLKEIKKDRAAVHSDWRADAEKRARLELALADIARREDIVAPKEEVEAEVKRILEHYKDAKRENARLFVENTMLNQKTISFLEAQK